MSTRMWHAGELLPECGREFPIPRQETSEKPPSSLSGAFCRQDDPWGVIPDKIVLVRSWGLSVASGRHAASGWLRCHAIDRDDNNPSASIHAESGWFSEPHTKESLSLFDLAARLGAFRDWQEAKEALGEQYLGVHA